jgi:hypothetical protein
LADKLYQPPKTFETFPMTVVHTDGSTFSLSSTLPLQPRLVLHKDTVHHPLWNPRISASQLDTTSEAFQRFKGRFMGVDAVDKQGSDVASSDKQMVSEDILADLAFSEEATGTVTIVQNIKGAGTAAGGKKKKRR